MSIKKWPKVGGETVLAEHFKKVFVVQNFRDPITNEVKDYSLFHNDHRKKAILVFPTTEAQTVITVKQFRHAANDVLYELPGGNSNSENETPLEAVIRELSEETGYAPKKVIPLRPQRHSGYWFESSTISTPYKPFLATGCRQIFEQKLDHDEYIEIVEMPLERWFALIANGTITDSKSIVITFLVLPHLGINMFPTLK